MYGCKPLVPENWPVSRSVPPLKITDDDAPVATAPMFAAVVALTTPSLITSEPLNVFVPDSTSVPGPDLVTYVPGVNVTGTFVPTTGAAGPPVTSVLKLIVIDVGEFTLTTC